MAGARVSNILNNIYVLSMSCAKRIGNDGNRGSYRTVNLKRGVVN